MKLFSRAECACMLVSIAGPLCGSLACCASSEPLLLTLVLWLWVVVETSRLHRASSLRWSARFACVLLLDAVLASAHPVDRFHCVVAVQLASVSSWGVLAVAAARSSQRRANRVIVRDNSLDCVKNRVRSLDV
jgi:hypothetical protein